MIKSSWIYCVRILKNFQKVKCRYSDTEHVLFFNIESSVKITPAQLLNAYLIFNRKYIKTFDTVTIITKPLKCDFGPFANGIRYRHPKLSVVTFDGLNGLKEGSFIVSEPITLPVITEFIMGEKTEIICIAPDGHFCRLKDDEFLF